ncbi:hypothetical protein [Parabacteroides sp. FAFU027]|uniref:hypothetical protein n=1 Tax=Parabacteroides sp. FAFU027 TaxID=2922715 RepID=UPI001FAFB449|nr:hypothetical protein [Parabacteroides sp. FAFU027]
MTEINTRSGKPISLREVILIFREKPVWTIPLLAIIAINIAFALSTADLYETNIEGSITTAFFSLWFFSTSLILACVVLLQMMKQDKTEENENLVQALWRLLNVRTILFLLLSLGWVIISIPLLIFDFLFSNTYSKTEDLDFTLKVTAINVANGLSSISDLPLRLKIRAIRQIQFMILPVLIWEEKGLFTSYKRSKFIVRKQISETILNPDITYRMLFYALAPSLGLVVLTIKYKLVISTLSGWLSLIYAVILVCFMFYADHILVFDKYMRFTEENPRTSNT